jgi:D-alanyl-D-alanine dipeptidase
MANELSGAEWCTRFPASDSVDRLMMPFRDKVKRFLDALGAGEASVAIGATYRPKQLAYLMHYAWQIANRKIAPRAVPPLTGVEICWVHPTADESVAAAAAMVAAYGIAYEPLLTSRHTQGLAIDLDIAWNGDLAIDDAKGRHLAVDTGPRDGTNQALWGIGASFGVMKLASDPLHWSSDGH